MQNLTTKQLLKSIDIIFRESRKMIEDENIFDLPDDNLLAIQNYFGTTRRESFILAVIFVMSFDESKISISSLTEFFPNNTTNILLFRKELESLTGKGIFRKTGENKNEELFGVKYSVKQSIIIDILDGKPFNVTGDTEPDIYSLLERISKVIDENGDSCGETEIMCSYILTILEINRNIPFINAVMELNLKIDYTAIYLYVIWASLDRNLDAEANILLYSLYNQSSTRIRVMQSIRDGSNDLISRGLLEISENDFLSDLSLKVTELTINMAKEFGIKLKSKAKSARYTIKPESVKEKHLIFNENEMQQLSTLKNLLKEDCFENTQKRLSNRNLPEGITAILYGGPGTGKTESVLQIARETNREIMKVDISQTKSMWFGESEKVVKKIFSEYKLFVTESERTPLLFINEADALISKRHEASSSNTRNTENSIQNILLEELENFNGILLATTNLIGNLDRAFDRRFLFKIRFPEPNADIRAKIWKIKSPNLTDLECCRLAKDFDFSGGQIDNIIKKMAIEEAIYGKEFSIENIIELCNSETFVRIKSINKIGFLKYR